MIQLICDLCGGETAESEATHPACLRKLFGTPRVPELNLRLDDIQAVAQRSAGKLSISGAQPKVSLSLKHGKLIPVESGGEYILKPQTQTFLNTPENENLCTMMASHVGIDVPPHILIELKDGSYAYVSRRFDRGPGGRKIHVEDFQQILGLDDKYEGSFEQIGKTLNEVSAFPGLDAQYFFERVLFFFIIGNGDSHLKNFSVIHLEDGTIKLTPAYDIVSSRLAMPEEKGELAIPMNGKQNDILPKDFREFARYLGIGDKSLENILSRYRLNDELINALILTSKLPATSKKKLKDIMFERLRRMNLL